VYSAGDIERMATGLVETAKIFGKEYMAPLIQKGLSPQQDFVQRLPCNEVTTHKRADRPAESEGDIKRSSLQ